MRTNSNLSEIQDIECRINELKEMKYIERIFDIDLQAYFKHLGEHSSCTYRNIYVGALLLRDIFLWNTYKGADRIVVDSKQYCWIVPDWFIKNKKDIGLDEFVFKKVRTILIGVGLLEIKRKRIQNGSKTYYRLSDSGMRLLGVQTLRKYYTFIGGKNEI